MVLMPRIVVLICVGVSGVVGDVIVVGVSVVMMVVG